MRDIHVPTFEELAKMEQFDFLFPMQKSYTRKDGKRIVEGVASTESWDGQDEQILQDGIIIEPFLKSGLVNWNHDGKPQAQIGAPLEAEIGTHNGIPALYIKCRLFDDIPMADYAWQLIKALEKFNAEEGTDKHLGWSVEGAVLEKENGRIKRSMLRQMAMTHEPVNADTWAIAKSFATFAKSLSGMAIDTPNVSSPDGTQRTYDPTKTEDLDTGKRKHDCEGKTGQELEDCKQGITSTLVRSETYYQRTFGDAIFKSWDDMLYDLILNRDATPDEAMDFVRRLKNIGR